MKFKRLTQTLFASIFTVALMTPHQIAHSQNQIDVNTLTQQMSIKIDNFLKARLQRNKLGFKVIPKFEGGNIRLTVPSYMNRETIFDLTLVNGNILKGRVLNKALKEEVDKIAKNLIGPTYQSQIVHHPFPGIDKDYALTTTPFSHLYVKPIEKLGGNLATQVHMATPLKILGISPDGQFAHVKVFWDGYLAWIKRSDLVEVDYNDFMGWIKRPNVVITRTIDGPQKLYIGTILNRESKTSNTVKVSLPTKQTIQLDASDTREVIPSATFNAQALLNTAQQYLPQSQYGGGKYLWGGTVGRRLDCSGFVQTVYRMHNIFLPRDADQQMKFSIPVAPTLGHLDQLQPGDLVFFSKHRKWATHIGLYMGNYKVIHSSSGGGQHGVKISTLRGGGKYDRHLQRIYFGGGRVVRSTIGGGMVR